MNDTNERNVQQIISHFIYKDAKEPDALFEEMCEPYYYEIRQEIYRQMKDLEYSRKIVVDTSIATIYIRDDNIRDEVLQFIPFMLEGMIVDSTFMVKRKGELIGEFFYSGEPYVGPSKNYPSTLMIGTTGVCTFQKFC